jgi:ribonuclease HI
LLEVNIDGASRGNPGLSAIGIMVKNNGIILVEHAEFLGIRTNNQAEYEALKRALEICNQLDKEITILSDSELLVNQRNSKYRLRNQQLKIISMEISNLEKNFDKIQYKHISREKNNKADRLANKALNEYLKRIGSLEKKKKFISITILIQYIKF